MFISFEAIILIVLVAVAANSLLESRERKKHPENYDKDGRYKYDSGDWNDY